LTTHRPGRVRTIVEWVVGLTFIGIGVLGAFVPVLQGWVFVLAGLAILSRHSRWAHWILERLKVWGRAVRTKVRAWRSGAVRRDGSG